MDKRLHDRLKKIENSIDDLRIKERRFLELSAHEKVLYAMLYLKSSGSNIEERKAKVYASDDWKDFVSGHAEAETEYHESRRRYELRLKAYDAEHLTLKTETPVIKRQL